MRVEEWMTHDPITIEPGAPVLAALDLMLDRGIRHLPVVEAAGALIGIVSIDDLRAALPVATSLRTPLSAEERQLVRDYAVDDAMTWAPETVAPETPLDRAAERLAELRIGCLPVVGAGGRLVGILSETDALRALVASLRGTGAPRGQGRGVELEALMRELRAERGRLARQLERRRETGAAAGRLAALDRALAQAGSERLGLCAICGGEIPLPRLRSVPGTDRCVACARGEPSGVA